MLVSESGWIGRRWIWLSGDLFDSGYRANCDSDAVWIGLRIQIWLTWTNHTYQPHHTRMQAADLNLTLRLLLPKLPHHGPVLILTIGLIKPILRISATIQTRYIFPLRSGRRCQIQRKQFCQIRCRSPVQKPIETIGRQIQIQDWQHQTWCTPRRTWQSDNRAPDCPIH